MFRGSMRLAVDQWGKVESAEDQSFKPNVSAVQPQHAAAESCDMC
jgi:hypothetical protein